MHLAVIFLILFTKYNNVKVKYLLKYYVIMAAMQSFTRIVNCICIYYFYVFNFLYYFVDFTFKIVATYSAKKGAFHNKGSSISLASRGDSSRLSFGRFYCKLLHFYLIFINYFYIIFYLNYYILF